MHMHAIQSELRIFAAQKKKKGEGEKMQASCSRP